MLDLFVPIMMAALSQVFPEIDLRLTEVRHLSLRYKLPEYEDAEQWKRRAEEIGLKMRIALGLFPEIPRTPLSPHRIVCYEDEEVVVERVAFESFPGFYITGNLYRPKGRKGPFPAVLHPHGHVPQQEGRLEENERIRSMAMAKLGFVVFSYDMVGYGDQFQVIHRREETKREHLWGISKAAVQTWNSIRALDFLESIPEVDGNRIGCSGLSGGGTQTFLLTAVDSRVSVSVPVKMVSAHMQGGCICENPPNLRIDLTNPEIASLSAPRPLLLISDDGDWTNETPKYEFPFIQSIYRLLGASERCANAHFSEGHRFGKDSREAYYSWMVRWLKEGGRPLPERIREPEMKLPDVEKLRVWGDDLPKPKNAISWDDLVLWMIDRSKESLDKMFPREAKGFEAFQERMRNALRNAICVEVPDPDTILSEDMERVEEGGKVVRKMVIGRKGKGDRIPALLIEPLGGAREAVLLVAEDGAASAVSVGEGMSSELAKALSSHFALLAIDPFLTGKAKGERKRDAEFFTTYNRTDDAERVQDILTAISFLLSRNNRIHVVGTGNAGLWVLLARAVIPKFGGGTAIDLAHFDVGSDSEFENRLYIPLLRRIGDLRTALALLAPTPLLVYNPHPGFPREWAEAAYGAMDAKDFLSWETRTLGASEIASWLLSISGLRKERMSGGSD
jgi:dienelactone hydrolase